MVQYKRKKQVYYQEMYQLSWPLDIIRTIKVAGNDGQCIYKEWVTVKYPAEKQISDSKVDSEETKTSVDG